MRSVFTPLEQKVLRKTVRSWGMSSDVNPLEDRALSRPITQRHHDISPKRVLQFAVVAALLLSPARRAFSQNSPSSRLDPEEKAYITATLRGNGDLRDLEGVVRQIGRPAYRFLMEKEEEADPVLSYFNLESRESRRAKDILKRIDDSEVRVFFRERMTEVIVEPFVVFFLVGAAIVVIVRGIRKLLVPRDGVEPS